VGLAGAAQANAELLGARREAIFGRRRSVEIEIGETTSVSSKKRYARLFVLLRSDLRL